MDQLPRLGKREGGFYLLLFDCLLVIMWFLLERGFFFLLKRFPLPLGAYDGLRYSIVALPEPSI